MSEHDESAARGETVDEVDELRIDAGFERVLAAQGEDRVREGRARLDAFAAKLAAAGHEQIPDL
ncbi:hypothetical protein ACIBSV_37025 [Embleya sp. NPDC050154]|uniref:hypothetical protein n=1 Tax=unclassified Embleya TaxID=2699296 RepID=UPI0037A9E833